MMARRPALSQEALPLEVLIRTFLILPSRLITNDTAACNVVEFLTPGSIDNRSQLGSTRRLAAWIYQPKRVAKSPPPCPGTVTPVAAAVPGVDALPSGIGGRPPFA